MIVTLTMNPAVDQTAWVDRLVPGEVHRVRETHVDPAGKGINASRMAHRLGWPTIAFGILAGDTGNIVERALAGEGVQHHFVRVPGQTRINTTVVAADGTATSFYAPGPAVSEEGATALDEFVRFWLQAGRVLVLAGSLPARAPPDTYARYVEQAREHGVIAIVDADGEALRLALGARPDLIKPNVAEAERLLGRALPDEGAVVRAAKELAARAGIVVISMGARGAVCAREDCTWRVRPPDLVPRSTVGSGDSMVAGLAVALARGDDLERGLRLGTAAGAATAASAGTALGTATDVALYSPQVRIERIS